MFRFKLTPDHGEPFEIESDSRDIAVWERVKPNRSFQGLTDGMRYADLYEIAWNASRRQGFFTGPLAEFETGHALELLKKDQEAADPTHSDQSSEEPSG